MSEPSSSLPEFPVYPRQPVEVFVYSRPRHRYWLHGLLLLATLFTTLTVGAQFQYNFLHHLPVIGDDFPFPLMWVLRHPANLLLGIPFAFSLLGILLAHEMGHYLYCRKYHVDATLPFFLPAPTLIGTLGAFIRIKSPIRTRRALFDIGIGGPIAGFVLAVPLMFLGLMLSRAGRPQDADFGFPLIFSLAHRICGPRVPLSHIRLHPVAIAAWFGMFATALNLLPGGQLDGGHIIASVWPRAHRWITYCSIAALVALSWYCFVGWLLWAIFLFVARRHPYVPQLPKLNAARVGIALLGMIMLVVTLAPRPFEFQDPSGDGMSVRDIVVRTFPQFRHGGIR